MGGTQNKRLDARIPETLHARLKKAGEMKSGEIGKEVGASEIVRVAITPFCDFTDVHGRLPKSFEELCRWYLKQKKAG